MCCLAKPLGDGLPFETPEVPVPPATMEEGSAEAGPARPDPDGALSPLEKEVFDEYGPVWFGRSAGWTGATYQDAREFCRAVGGPDRTFRLCPIEAYCPSGRLESKPQVYQTGPNDREDVQWSPISNAFNGWVVVGDPSADHPDTCKTHLELTQHDPDWGIDGSLPEMKQRVLCCMRNGEDEGASTPKKSKPTYQTTPADPTEEGATPQSSSLIESMPSYVSFEPTFSPTFSPTVAPMEDVVSNPQSSSEQSLQSSSQSAIQGMTILNPAQVMPSSSAVDYNGPFWFDDSDGWMGSTYDDAKAFCKSVPNEQYPGEPYHLCPLTAYCPNGPNVAKPLVYNGAAFEGEQWSPISDVFNGWVMVGTLSESHPWTCKSHLELTQHDPGWGIDGTFPQLKKYILCCTHHGEDGGATTAKPASQSPIEALPTAQPPSTEIAVAGVGAKGEGGAHSGAGNSSPLTANHEDAFVANMKRALDPIWFDSEEGWNGGSWEDARRFCDSRDRELCPYTAYCPHGPTHPALEGHDQSLMSETFDQYAPTIDGSNEWVLIWPAGNNKSIQCMDYMMLNGGESPPWGLERSRVENKRHVLCCDKSEFMSAAEVQQQQEQLEGGIIDEVESPRPTPKTSQETSADNEATTQKSILFHVGNGWNAGSHDDAVHFCMLKEVNATPMELCPYEAYCPSGTSRPPAGVLGVVGDEEVSEQWAPMSGEGGNQWVMVGTRGHNTAVQCLTHDQLYGDDVEVELSPDKKQYIMCCEPRS